MCCYNESVIQRVAVAANFVQLASGIAFFFMMTLPLTIIPLEPRIVWAIISGSCLMMFTGSCGLFVACKQIFYRLVIYVLVQGLVMMLTIFGAIDFCLIGAVTFSIPLIIGTVSQAVAMGTSVVLCLSIRPQQDSSSPVRDLKDVEQNEGPC